MTVAPRLFEAVTEFAEKVSAGAKLPDELSGSHQLPVFCENFMLQFSLLFGERAEGFNDRSLRQLQQIGRTAPESADGLPVKRLAYQLEQVCVRFPKGQYGGRRESADWFLRSYMPELLEVIENWARLSQNDAELRLMTVAARESYRAALHL